MSGNGDEGGAEGGGDASEHPSPMVQAAFGGRGGFAYRGRGFIRGGRGRGRGGRAHVVSMIQSRTWVRQKDGGSGGDGAEGADAAASAPAPVEG